MLSGKFMSQKAMKGKCKNCCCIPRAVMIPLLYPCHMSGTKLSAAKLRIVRYVSMITLLSVNIIITFLPIIAKIKQQLKMTEAANWFETFIYSLAYYMLPEPIQWPTHI